LMTTIILLFDRPGYMSFSFAIGSLSLNAINVISTAVWQGRIHGQLERVGFDERLLNQLIGTNWIRTATLIIQALVALYIVMKALK
jgi:hypothetical protein